MPNLTPYEAFNMLKTKQTFSFGDFMYYIDIDRAGVDVECISTKEFWVASGDHGDPVTEETEWVK